MGGKRGECYCTYCTVLYCCVAWRGYSRGGRGEGFSPLCAVCWACCNFRRDGSCVRMQEHGRNRLREGEERSMVSRWLRDCQECRRCRGCIWIDRVSGGRQWTVASLWITVILCFTVYCERNQMVKAAPGQAGARAVSSETYYYTQRHTETHRSFRNTRREIFSAHGAACIPVPARSRRSCD